jgi:DNA-binding transcriptional ArsR family regulator
LGLEVCTQNALHPEALEAARAALADAPLVRLAELFKVLGDPTRSGILLALGSGIDGSAKGGATGSENVSRLCVCDLAELFGVSSAAISHHLRLLKAHRLVRSTREGKIVFYALDDEHVAQLFSQGFEHVKEGG